MGGEWPHMTLKDAGVILIDCVHKTPADAGKGLPYIAIPQMKEGRIDFNANPRLISESDFSEWTKKANPQKSDVVLSRRCNPGETAYVPMGVQFALGQNLVLLRSNGSYVYPPFLQWLTKGHQWWDQISKFLNVGAVFDSLKCADVPNFELTIPPIEDQKSIAHILGTLDDKIELNRQMNTTLEAMAQALFKSWFVDFDPVIDNALAADNPIPEPLHARAEIRKALGDKRKPLPEAMQKQFPSSFVFSEEMGWIPEGWESVTFEHLVKAKQGRYLAKDEMHDRPDNECKYPVWGGNGILGFSKNKAYEAPVTLMTCRGSNCGLIRSTQSAAWVSNNSFACKAKYGSEYFLYLYLLNDNFSDCISGSAQPQITYTALRNKRMKFPVSHQTCKTFSDYVSEYREKQFKNDGQIESLTNLRDTLLPKLLSGQLRIPAAEKIVQEAL